MVGQSSVDRPLNNFSKGHVAREYYVHLLFSGYDIPAGYVAAVQDYYMRKKWAITTQYNTC